MSADKKEMRILILEDVPSDAELVECELRDAGLAYTSLRVDTRKTFEQALDEFKPDIVLADYNLPSYNGRDAMEHTRRVYPQIPVIIVTGSLGDEAAVELLKLGARDYVLKGNLVRLVPAIRRALSEEEGIRNRKLAEEKYRALFVEAKDGIVLIDCETGCVMDCNTEFERQSGRSLDQLKSLKIWELRPAEKKEASRNKFLEIREAGSGGSSELELQRPNGDIVPVDFLSKVITTQNASFIQSISRDITEQRKAERALRDSEERYKRITEGLTDYQYTVRIEHGRAVKTTQSPACMAVTGYKAEEFAANHNLWIQMIVPEDRELVIQRVNHILAGEDVPPIEHRITRKDGEIRWVSDTIIMFKDTSGKLISYDGVIRDITKRKTDEAGLKLFRALIDQSNDAVEVSDPVTLQLIDVNETACRSLGYSRDELLSMHIGDIDPDMSETQLKKIGENLQAHGSTTFETRHRRKDGSKFPVEVSVTAVRIDKDYGVSVVRDITERKRGEDALRRANRALKTLSAGNLALVRATSEAELLRAATAIIVEQGGYSMAMVCYAEDDPKKSIKPMAWSGAEAGYLWVGQPSWADTEQGQLPVSRAMRSGTMQIRRDIASESGFKPWREAALTRGYVSNIALPLSDGDKNFGGLSIYSSEADAFDEEEVRLLEELANDLAYGIITLRTRVAHEQQAAILRQSLEQSIQTIAGTLEARDPYTAGHQRRVAELATAIAREMGLPYELVEGIHFAAIVHDLGKIHIPSEILSKPGKLTDIEFMLIKTHPEAGYDILKNVKFPWPIADIVLQHHEKLDGSGYPQGLRGGQILLEARILTVADVVEAMSSHRPYRPTLGVEAALQEIERGRGSVYDPAVADACLRLFAKKGFTFSNPSS